MVHILCRSIKAACGIGYIRLFKIKTGIFPLGLIGKLVRFLQDRDYKVILDSELALVSFDDEFEVFEDEIRPNLKLTPYDYQEDAFSKAIRSNRALILSPTASGKSFIIYLILCLILLKLPDDKKVLISVPTKSLVRQLHKDFGTYEINDYLFSETYEFASGKSKYTDCRIVIATWSMLMIQASDWFNQFGAFVCDEAHQAKSKALDTVLNNLLNAKYRFRIDRDVGRHCNARTSG
jgi:superfamily II DNA or RNA helicase